MSYIQLSDFVYDCSKCHTRCDGVSKGVYIFGDDTAFSEKYENMLIEKINANKNYKAKKSESPGYPDIEIQTAEGILYSFLEVKVQQRTFMRVQEKLPQAKLKPSETVALNLSDLLRYFEIKKTTGFSISIVWVLLNRLCLVAKDNARFFFQSIDKLEEIYNRAKDTRRFRRESGEGDIVDGVHKGVTVNYHFSLKELKEWKNL